MKYLLYLFFIPSIAFAQTDIFETNVHYAHWTKDGSPYRVYEALEVDSLLIIDPGVRVEFVSKRDGSQAGI